MKSKICTKCKTGKLISNYYNKDNAKSGKAKED